MARCMRAFPTETPLKLLQKPFLFEKGAAAAAAVGGRRSNGWRARGHLCWVGRLGWAYPTHSVQGCRQAEAEAQKITRSRLATPGSSF